MIYNYVLPIGDNYDIMYRVNIITRKEKHIMKKPYKVRTARGIEERLGVDLPAFENMGLYLFIYRYEEDRKKVWYIVDKRTGLSVMKAHTRKEALERFYTWTKEPKNVDRLKDLIIKTIEKDGEVNHVSVDYLQ